MKPANGNTLCQLNMFGPPEPLESYASEEARRGGRQDDRPVPSERENLWPRDLVATLGLELLEYLYGDIPRRTLLKTKEVCRRMRWDSNTVYRRIEEGSLDACPAGEDGNPGSDWKIYRYSLVSWRFNREFRDMQTRGCDLNADELDRVERAVAARKKKQQYNRSV